MRAGVGTAAAVSSSKGVALLDVLCAPTPMRSSLNERAKTPGRTKLKINLAIYGQAVDLLELSRSPYAAELYFYFQTKSESLFSYTVN